jgi:hypothetical protein
MIVKGIGVGIIGGVLCFLLSEMGSRLAKPIGALSAVLMLITALSGISEIGGEARAFMAEAGLSEIGLDVMRVVGTGYVFGACADTVEGLGEGGISRTLDTLCRVEIMLITLPYVKEILSFGLSLIK